MNTAGKIQSAVIACPKRRLGSVIRACKTKLHCAKFLWGEQGYVNTDAKGHPHARTLNMYT